MLKQLFQRHANIFGDLAKQDRRDIAAGMHWDGRRAAVGMAKLLVGAALAYFHETTPREKRDYLARFKDRNPGHLNDYGVGSDKFGLQLWLTILEQHRYHLAEIRMQLVERCPLAVRTREAGNVPDIQVRFRAVLDDSGVATHVAPA